MIYVEFVRAQSDNRRYGFSNNKNSLNLTHSEKRQSRSNFVIYETYKNWSKHAKDRLLRKYDNWKVSCKNSLFFDILCGGNNLLCVFDIIFISNVHHRGPTSRYDSSGSGSADRWRAVNSAGPIGSYRVLVMTENLVSIENHWRAFRSESILEWKIYIEMKTLKNSFLHILNNFFSEQNFLFCL